MPDLYCVSAYEVHLEPIAGLPDFGIRRQFEVAEDRMVAVLEGIKTYRGSPLGLYFAVNGHVRCLNCADHAIEPELRLCRTAPFLHLFTQMIPGLSLTSWDCGQCDQQHLGFTQAPAPVMMHCKGCGRDALWMGMLVNGPQGNVAFRDQSNALTTRLHQMSAEPKNTEVLV